MPNRFQQTMQRVARGLFGVTFGGPGVESWASTNEWLKGHTTRTSDLSEPYRQHATIGIAIGTIAEDAASVPWELYPDGAEDSIESHPVLDLWEKPNKNMNGLQLWVGTYVSYMLFGESFWYYPDVSLNRSTGSRALSAISRLGEGLVLLDPRRMTYRVEGGDVKWYIRTGDSVDVPLDGDRLTPFRRYNPYNHVRGLSKVEAIIAEAAGDHAAAQWNERFFGENNGMASGLLVPAIGANLTPDQRNDLLRTWNQRHGQTKRSIGVLPAGWDFKDLGISQRDMDFKGLREYSREQILAMFGVPPFLAGVMDKANYANAREQKEVYWYGTIQRFLTEIQATINADFLPKLGIENISAYPNWEIVKALTENLAEKVIVAKELFSMGFTKAMINERLDLGFDVDMLDDADIGYLPFSLSPVALLSEPRTPAGPATPPPEDDEEPDPEDEEKRFKGPLANTAREARRALVWRAIVSQTRDIEIQIDKTTRRFFRAVRDGVMAQLGGPKGWLIKQGIEDMDIEQLLAFIEDEGKKYYRAMTPQYKAAMKRGGEAIVLETGVAISFNLLDPEVIAALGRLYNRSKLIEETVYRQLQNEIAESMAAHETLAELTARVEAVTDASMSRAHTIARTESGAAYGGGRYESMKQAGIKRHEWLSSHDPDVRDTHAGLDGQPRDIGSPFSNGLMYPKDPSGPPEEVINCRCVAIPVVEE